MFPTFTGNSRRSRQVNLSGRVANGPATRAATTPGMQNAMAHAHQERLARQQERDRQNAARQLQRVWRGYCARKQLQTHYRSLWDLAHRNPQAPPPDQTEVDQINDTMARPSSTQPEADLQDELDLLLRFVVFSDVEDLHRLNEFAVRFLNARQRESWPLTNPSWRRLAFRLATHLLSALALVKHRSSLTKALLPLLAELASSNPEDVARFSSRYYRVLASLTTGGAESTHQLDPTEAALVIQCVVAPLQMAASHVFDPFYAFIWHYLTTPELPTRLGDLAPLAAAVDFQRMMSTMASSIHAAETLQGGDTTQQHRLMWLLSYLIFFRRRALTETSDPLDCHLDSISRLLLRMTSDIAAYFDDEDDTGFTVTATAEREPSDAERPHRRPQPLAPFVREQLLSLVDEREISRIVTRSRLLISNRVDTRPSPSAVEEQNAMQTATYILGLMRAFPRKADDIRMWLYLSSTSSEASPGDDGARRVPALAFFWNAASRTEVFRRIKGNARKAIPLVRPTGVNCTMACVGLGDHRRGCAVERNDRAWRMILLFLELYSFVLKIVDDDEFFSGSTFAPRGEAEQGRLTWAQQSALPLSVVKDLTIFLKNLCFAIYWFSLDVDGAREETLRNDRSRRRAMAARPCPTSPTPRGGPVKSTMEETPTTVGPAGIKVGYVKVIATGLLKMLYERDSRRPFLPPNHWLMTIHLDMDAFIPAVVDEEEKRRHLQRVGPAEDGEAEGDPASNVNDIEALEEGAQQIGFASVRPMIRYPLQWHCHLYGLTPRLEILENMPFFILFPTRVKIFRKFVEHDIIRRRGDEELDADHWRVTLFDQPPGGRRGDGFAMNYAQIRRTRPFEDAFAQLYPLGADLKDPIQITFVDRFDHFEAGIDGGGVTKEFLTSITKEAFSAHNGLRLFVETDQHLLYPNPAIFDELREYLRQTGVAENTPPWLDQMTALSKRYEFLGRIIGKCMYEGILVDVRFAGFFLRKWSLSRSSASDPAESARRASLNELRELDESIYQGLVRLKNYEGDVEDFALDFTIIDTLYDSPPGAADMPHHPVRTITRELKPGFGNTAVTNENRLLYISYVAYHRLHTQLALATNSFLKGLGQIVDPSWLSMFNQTELQTLVSGASSDLDLDDLRKHTQYGGVYVIGDDGEEHPVIQLFWDVLESFSDEQRRGLLRFVTSSPRAPLLGFEHLYPLFTIRDSSTDQGRLPTSSTCVNLLKLPRYNDRETLREKLLYAINAEAGFDLS